MSISRWASNESSKRISGCVLSDWLSLAKNTGSMQLHSILLSTHQWILALIIFAFLCCCSYSIRFRLIAGVPAFSKNRQCSVRDFQCLRSIRSVISSLRPPNDTVGFQDQNETGLQCECMPGCSETVNTPIWFTSLRNLFHLISSSSQQYDVQFVYGDRQRSPKNAQVNALCVHSI